MTAVLDCEKPVVAAVNGTAAGAGMHLALACDVVVMSDAAKLVPVFVRRGIAPDAAGAYLLTRLVGPQRAKQIYLFGDDIPAAQAYEWGLVDAARPRRARRSRRRPQLADTAGVRADPRARGHQAAGQQRARRRPRHCVATTRRGARSSS